MSKKIHRAVLDCTILAQALINPNGPAGECVERSTRGEYSMVISEFVIREVLELSEKIPARYSITPEKIKIFLRELLPSAQVIEKVPNVFDHPIDPDDSHYVNLALAADAFLIVSRDRHLLGLNDPQKSWSAEFRKKFPQIKILQVEKMLTILREQKTE